MDDRQYVQSTLTPQIHYYRGDLPNGLLFRGVVAIDTETMGLVPQRDRLCVIQLSTGNGQCHIVHLTKDYNCPNLKTLLTCQNLLKVFHFARLDLSFIQFYLHVQCQPVYCTKLASRLVRTNIDRHSLKDLCHDLLNVEISKQEQTSDWGTDNLTLQQMQYAAQDVLYLHLLKERLDLLLEREGRLIIAKACFDFLPYLATLDLSGWTTEIFSH